VSGAASSAEQPMEHTEREAWFKQSVENHIGIFLKTAHGFAADAADRDDLVQEMLLSAWQALPTYQPNACKLPTFLYRVAHNRALNWQRSRSRYQHKLQRFSEYPQLALATDDSSARQRQLDWLYALIRRLPAADRTLIMLQLDQLSLREIAEVTGLSESNVGVRLHRIKQWLSAQKTEFAHEP
jgi:RNA polymerase sigma-70 factor, ECF subfamily